MYVPYCMRPDKEGEATIEALVFGAGQIDMQVQQLSSLSAGVRGIHACVELV